MKKVFIAQARMTSSRLPGKITKDICGMPAFYRIIERMKLSRHEPEIIIATTINHDDDILEELAKEYGVKVYRGSEENVLSRFYYAAKEFGADVIGRVTCDDLLFDPRWLFDDLLDEFLEDGNYDYMKTMTYRPETNEWVNEEPSSGCMAEIFTFKGLEKCFFEATNKYCIEHVTPYFYMNPEIFRCGGHGSGYSGPNILPKRYGTALDTEADLKLLREIYEELYPKNHAFSILDIIVAYQSHPEWIALMDGIERTPVTYHGESGKVTINCEKNL